MTIRDRLWHELIQRGFSTDGESPNGTMGLTDAYSSSADLAELLDVMVARREKVFGSVAVVGHEAAKRS